MQYLGDVPPPSPSPSPQQQWGERLAGKGLASSAAVVAPSPPRKNQAFSMVVNNGARQKKSMHLIVCRVCTVKT